MIQKNHYTILAIETSLDETCAAITVDGRVFSNVISSQVELHKKYGGVVPIIAKRAHEERIDAVVEEALSRARSMALRGLHGVDAIAVTRGPGQALALEVGIRKAKELATQYNKPLVAVSHLEGHLLSAFARNAKGKGSVISDTLSKARQGRTATLFPLLGLLVSGGHTQIVLVDTIGTYQLLGETLDDAAGEAFDKVGRMLGIGYPGGAIIERLAQMGDETKFDLPVPMVKRRDLNLSFSGLKTAVLYKVREMKKNGDWSKESIQDMAASFQCVLTKSLIKKLTLAVHIHSPKGILLGGGVVSNVYIRRKIRTAMRKKGIPVYIPYSKKLFTDNAAMIGVAAYFKAERGEFVADIGSLERDPSLSL